MMQHVEECNNELVKKLAQIGFFKKLSMTTQFKVYVKIPSVTLKVVNRLHMD